MKEIQNKKKLAQFYKIVLYNYCDLSEFSDLLCTERYI